MTTFEVWTELWDWGSGAWIAAALITAAYVWISKGRFTKRAWFFVVGMVLFLLSMLSPIEALANEYLFTAHMVQHMLLVLTVPPLWVLSLNREPVERFVKTPVGNFMDKYLGHPPTSFILGLGMMALWHIPEMCTASVRHQPIHNLQYASLLIGGMFFYWPIANPIPKRRMMGISGLGYLTAASAACMLMGIYITYTNIAICPCYLNPPDTWGILNLIQQDWGMTPKTDQQLGGLTMWIPGCLIYFTAGMIVLVRYFSGLDDVVLGLTTQENPDGAL